MSEGPAEESIPRRTANGRWPDLLSGGCLAAFGVFILSYTVINYDLGTLSRIGPGGFPAGLGVLLCAIGLGIATAGLGAEPVSVLRPRARPIAAVLAAVMAFALAIEPLGIIPAIVLLVLFASLARGRIRILESGALGAGLALLAVLVFKIALDLPFVLFVWPG